MELKAYASGSGALSFCWQEKDHRTNQTIATGRTVTMNEARDYLANRKRAEHLRAKGWKVWDSGCGGPVLVPNMERTGPDTIRMDGKEYKYIHNQADPFFIRDGDIRAAALRVTFRLEAEGYEPEEDREVKNLGTLSSIAYFLRNEKGMQERPPESVTYNVI